MAKWWEDVIERYPRLQLGGNSEVSMKWKEKITWLSGSNPLLLRGVEEAFRAGEDSCAADLPTDTSIRQARLLEMIYDCKGWSDAIARIHTFANKVMSRSKRDKER